MGPDEISIIIAVIFFFLLVLLVIWGLYFSYNPDLNGFERYVSTLKTKVDSANASPEEEIIDSLDFDVCQSAAWNNLGEYVYIHGLVEVKAPDPHEYDQSRTFFSKSEKKEMTKRQCAEYINHLRLFAISMAEVSNNMDKRKHQLPTQVLSIQKKRYFHAPPKFDFKALAVDKDFENHPIITVSTHSLHKSIFSKHQPRKKRPGRYSFEPPRKKVKPRPSDEKQVACSGDKAVYE